jgi:MFS family permease
MIASFGVERTEIARWAGLTGAVFSVAQSITAVPWGKASDRFGRKPILLLGLANTAVCFLLWGVATSLPMAITIRALMGGGNGNGTPDFLFPRPTFAGLLTLFIIVGIIRTMVAEMVPEKSLQPRAFSIMPLVWSIGSVFGPAFGGFFARPADQYPNIFGHIEFFKRFPFALPNLMACCIFLISFTTGLLFLKVCFAMPIHGESHHNSMLMYDQETLHTKRHQRDWGLVLGEKLTRSFKRSTKSRRRRLSFVDAEASAPLVAQSSAMSSSEHLPAPKEEVRTKYADLFTRQTTIALVSYTFLALHSVAYDQVLPVFLNYPVVEPDKSNTRLPFWFTGGFGLSSDKIGTIYTVYGIACGVIQFFLFPALCARFGVLNCYRVACKSLLFKQTTNSLPPTQPTLTNFVFY